MRNLTTKTFSPDGFGGETAAVVTAPAAQTRRDEMDAMEIGRCGTDDDHDDGLVHSHVWAKTTTIR